MGRREEIVETCAKDLREKCGVTPDMALLAKVVAGLGPSVYNADGALVAGGDPEEIARVRAKFLIGKLGLKDGPELDAGIDKVMETYGRSNRAKHRGVVYYLLAVHFGRQSVYG